MTKRLGSQRFKELEESFGPCLLFKVSTESKSRGLLVGALLAPQAQTSSHLKCTAVVTSGVRVPSGVQAHSGEWY